MASTDASESQAATGTTNSREHWFDRRPWVVLLTVLSLVSAIVLVGALTRVPVLSIGTALTPYTLAVTLFTVVLMMLSIVCLRARRTRARWAVAGASVVALVASSVVSVSMLTFARQENVALSTALFGEEHGDPHADIEIDAYTTFDGEDVGLSIWLPRDTTAKAPVAVFLHGGAWALGHRFNRGDMQDARWFSHHGYLVMSLDYSTSDTEHQNWDLQESQIACALVWADEHAGEYGGDTDRLALMGASAGGNLAFNVAAKVDAGTLTSSCGGQVPQVDAVSSLFGAPSPAAVWNDSDPIVRYWLRDSLTKHLGGSPQQYPERYAAMDSVLAVTGSTPPTLWAYGTNDHLVPTSSTEALLDRLRDVGVPTKVIEVPFSDHGIDNGNIGAAAWRQHTLEWFRSHGA